MEENKRNRYAVTVYFEGENINGLVQYDKLGIEVRCDNDDLFMKDSVLTIKGNMTVAKVLTDAIIEVASKTQRPEQVIKATFSKLKRMTAFCKKNVLRK